MSVTSVARDDPWARDVAKMLVGYAVGTLVAVVLVFTVLRWLFLGPP
ncbi:MAG: hypothetical protein ABEJ81_00515 [Haloferacaceae archaeon]